MANPGVGTKFLSVNLNKSYGQSSHHNHNHNHNHNHTSYSSSYGSTRARPSSHGGGGGGGMVVLSRPRSSQKSGPKLSVPPPLNLPSLRKEHERFDSLGSGGVHAGGGVSGTGSRPASSGVGWTKPAAVALQEKEGFGGDHVNDGVDQALQSDDGASKGSSGVYMPPSARLGVAGPSASVPDRPFPPVEKVAVLRGEDFPSLQASLPVPSGPAQKQKESLNQKKKQVADEESYNEQRDGYRLNSLVDMRPQLQSGRGSVRSGFGGNAGESHGSNGSHVSAQSRKQEEYFPGPLPLVRLNPRSDWADDERDTGHGLTERGRDHGYPKNEAFWDGDFDMPRASFLPHKPAHNLPDRRSQRDNETGKVSSSEVSKADLYSRDIRTPSEGREGNSWRVSSPVPRDGFSAQQVGIDRNGIGARSPSTHREPIRQTKYASSPFWDNIQDDFGKRGVAYGQGGKQPWTNATDSFASRGAERNARDRYGGEQYNRYRGETSQNSFMSKSSFSYGGKGLPVNDPILSFGREKRPLSKSEKPFFVDHFMKDFGVTGFDGRDPFSGSLVGVVKKKKDVLRQSDFHDPVRESFEAELERVQKMQEEERQRIIEEQEKALELARKEEEDRRRLVREQEERQRRVEEEAREAAWRAEQERLDAIRKAEELRIAREEEKHIIFVEEERRKQAAKQKLLELEERIARRQAEVAKSGSNSSASVDEKVPGMVKEGDISKVADVGEWEDGERMVERITTSASSDSSALNRSFEISSRHQFSRDGSSGIMDRGKPVNSWRRDSFENANNSNFIVQDSENGHHNPQRDASVGTRIFNRKDFYGATGFASSRSYYKAGFPEHIDEFSHPKGQRWNISGDGDQYNRNTEIESEYHENLGERYGEIGWGQSQGRPRVNPYSPYAERLYQNSEGDGYYSFGRPRYSVRQPRVPPPASLASMQKASYRGETERPGPSTFLDAEMPYNHPAESESMVQSAYDSGHLDSLGQPGIADVQENTQIQEQKLDRNPAARCDSQSSLSVSSPPNSPIHLSHDDLDESGDSSMLSAAGESKDGTLAVQGREPVLLPTEVGNDIIAASGSVSSGDDEEWTLDDNEQLQEQEEYDEDEDGYQEEDEVHDGDDENIDLTQDFEEMRLNEKGSPYMDNLVLGFNEGVQVGMPNDEIERSSRNEETGFMVPHLSVGTIEGQESFEGLSSDEQKVQSVDVPSEVGIDSSSRIFHETENSMEDWVIQPANALQSSTASELADHVDASGSSAISAQHVISSSVHMASHTSPGQAVLSATSAVPSQPEVPVKLQFGLFSGPSLIPSPIPAIQIGSIQMPLHLHPQVGQSLTHMHRSQPPIFQFGQLRYTSSISQGVLPLPPQSMSFVQPNIPSNFSLNQNHGVSLPIQPAQEISVNNLVRNDALSILDNQAGIIPRSLDHSYENVSKEINPLPARERAETVTMQQNQAEISLTNDKNIEIESSFQGENQVPQNLAGRNFKALSTRESQSSLQNIAVSSQSVSKEKVINGPKSQSQVYGGRGKRYVFTVKNSSSRSSNLQPDNSRSESNGYQRRQRRQRTEFRIRESQEKRQVSSALSSNQLVLDDKLNSIGKGAESSMRSTARKVVLPNKALKSTVELERLGSGPVCLQEMDSGSKFDRRAGRESMAKSQNTSNSGEVNLKRNIHSEEDVDAPLPSGIVRIFEQPGIEAPSDEDDFIEVRSKRQMLNDRREQREKEIKAKSRATKMPRKPRSSSQSAVVSASSSKISATLGGEAANNNIQTDFVTAERHNVSNKEASTGFTAPLVSQPLAPIGTPAVKADAKADVRSQSVKSIQMSSLPTVSGSGKNLASSFIFETKNKVLDNVQTSLGSWTNQRINQQVMALTQTQLDEAMKPVQFDSRAAVGDHPSSVNEASMPSSILAKDKSFSSATSPVNSLLAGEKIQFGAVTSPTILPPCSRAVSLGIGPPGPCRPDLQISRTLSAADNDCSLFFEKEKHSSEPCVPIEDCEAEAAASAVAVAAITSDEIGGNGMGVRSVSVADTKSFGGADLDGVAGDPASQSRAEEPLSVALPADLSVETSPISLWPPLQSPQNSSSQMISHFPGGPPSHFPFYEMNPMLGGPIFAFGPHDESASTQSQSQKSSVAVSGPLGAWQQCHSGVDSFYGPPAGFTGPFISPPGGIPGVQGPPHMVVYNHFAPVGQYGQVGLSFMGTAYIPSGKQPDWKHNPVSSAMGGGEGDLNNLTIASNQRNPTNMPASVQHLAPGSPLLPMASPLAMFDVSPFQSSPDMPVQARWSHIPASSLQSVPLSMPLQQLTEGVLSPQFNHVLSPVDQSLTVGRFPETRTSTPSDSSRNFPVVTDVTVTQLPDELGLVDPSSATSSGASAQVLVPKSSSLSTLADTSKTDVAAQNSGNNSTGRSTSSAFKSQAQQKNISTQQYGNSTGYNQHRAGSALQKSSSGGEWSHRRTGFQGRNQSMGGEKSFLTMKMKQIYVAKQTSTGTSTPSLS